MIVTEYVCECVVPALQDFVGEVAGHYNPIILTTILNPKDRLAETLGKLDLAEGTQTKHGRG